MQITDLPEELRLELEREAKLKYPVEMFFDVVANGYIDINAGKRGAWKGGAMSETAAKIHQQGMISVEEHENQLKQIVWFFACQQFGNSIPANINPEFVLMNFKSQQTKL